MLNEIKQDFPEELWNEFAKCAYEVDDKKDASRCLTDEMKEELIN